jgi:hypothetical protein
VAIIRKRKGKEALSHCMMERERRKRMKDMFTDLRSLLPNVNEKVRLSRERIDRS